MSTTSATDPAVAAAVATLKKACDEAYVKYNNSCSHAVWYVLTQIVDSTAAWKEANQLVHDLTTSTDWKKVTVDEGWALAQKGIVVIGGRPNPGGHGHVIVIYPGDKINSGGYLYTRFDKKTQKNVTELLRSHGVYPRALSTSSGAWPGAKSKGDKTVWDPFGTDEAFEETTFWTRK